VTPTVIDFKTSEVICGVKRNQIAFGNLNQSWFSYDIVLATMILKPESRISYSFRHRRQILSQIFKCNLFVSPASPISSHRMDSPKVISCL
jgi:hypothetical protein